MFWMAINLRAGASRGSYASTTGTSPHDRGAGRLHRGECRFLAGTPQHLMWRSNRRNWSTRRAVGGAPCMFWSFGVHSSVRTATDLPSAHFLFSWSSGRHATRTRAYLLLRQSRNEAQNKEIAPREGAYLLRSGTASNTHIQHIQLAFPPVYAQ